MSDPFDELVDRVKALTGLAARPASAVASSFEDDAVPSAGAIVNKARELGYEIPQVGKDPSPPMWAEEVSMDPAVVLAEVYERCPRVLCQNFPSIGRAPEELVADEALREEIAQLPEDIRVLLVKVSLEDRSLTIWLRDEANDVDRPIGPVDLRRYQSGQQMHDAIRTLLARLPLVLRSDCN